MFSNVRPYMLIDLMNKKYHSLKKIVPESELPKTVKDRLPIKYNGRIFGKGRYGIVLESNDKNKVIKLTTDVSEATFASTYLANNWQNNNFMNGIVKYYQCIEIGSVYTSVYGNTINLKVYYIVREGTIELNNKNSKEYGTLSDILYDSRYDQQTMHLFKIRDKKVYQLLERHMFKISSSELTNYFTQKKINKRHLMNVDNVVSLCESIKTSVGTLSQNETFYDSAVSLDRLINYHDTYLCDTHIDNFRWALRDEGTDEERKILVISDPGHFLPMPWAEITNPPILEA